MLQIVIRLDFLHCAFDLTDVVGQIFGNVVADLIRQSQTEGKRLVFRDRPACFVVGRLDVHNQTPFKTGAQTVLQTEHIAWHTVGGQNDLTVVFVQGVEGVEEFLLCLLLAGDKLNIVNQKQVGIAVFVAEFKVFTAADRFDEFIDKLIALDIDDVVIRMLLLDAVGDGIEQMRFAQAALSVDKQRIIGGGSFLRDGFGSGKGVLVGRADNKGIKGVIRIEFHKGAAFFVQGVLRKFLLIENDQLNFGLELIAHGFFNQLGVAADDNVLAEGGGRVDHKLFFVQLHDLGIVKIGHDSRRRRVLFEVG